MEHVFVLMGVYFWRNAFISYAAGDRMIAAFELVWGITAALAASVAAGAVPLVSTDTAANFLVAGAPIVGVFVYEMVDVGWRATFYRERAARIYHLPTPTWWKYFYGGLRGSFGRTFIALLLLWSALNVAPIQRLPSPGLALLTVLVVIQAMNFLRIGLSDVKFIRAPGEPWQAAYWRTGSAKVGAAMLGVFFWLSVFLMTNAGLGFYGL